MSDNTLAKVARRAEDAYRRRTNRPGSLRARVRALEAEVQEQRALNRRIAELTDVVAELLLPIHDQDKERVEQVLAEYRSKI